MTEYVLHGFSVIRKFTRALDWTAGGVTDYTCVASCISREAAIAAMRLLSGECLRGLDPNLSRRDVLDEARRKPRG